MGFLVPRRTTLPFFTACIDSLVKITVQESSHSFPMEIKEALLRPGNIFAERASLVIPGSNGIYPFSEPVDTVASGNITGGVLWGLTLTRQWLSTSLKKLSDAPESPLAITRD